MTLRGRHRTRDRIYGATRILDPSHPLAGTNYWLAGDDAYCGNANLSNNILVKYDLGGG
eukprot:SAG25_NODE_65_length_17663_cov_18.359656_8_plen_59_part_00